MHPKVEPHASGLLAMSDGQQVYWEESGNPDGLPLVYLHGGPGSGLGSRGYVTKADPSRYRIIGLDQRGCGRSVPLATDPAHDLDANTTPRLIADIEELRGHLGIGRWVVNGVSWGSTLAIAYAHAHPERVLGVVCMAVTTTSRWEIDWITETVGAIYPEEWDRFATHAEEAGTGYRRGQGRLVEAYRRLLRHTDPAVRDAASRAWTRWEDVHISIGAGGFCDPPLLERMDRVAGIPAYLIHGRPDVSSPVRIAWELHRRWPGSRLVVDEGEGHGGTSMVQAWRDANDELAACHG